MDSSDDRRFNWILPALAAMGFGCMLVLPFASAWIHQSAQAVALQRNGHVDLFSRTLAFFLAVFGAWGFVVYLWACCAFSQSKGKSWTWGLLAVPSATSLILMAIFGSPALSLLCVFGLPGFLVPLLLPIDRYGPVASPAARTSNLLNRLARHTTWVWALGLFLGASWSYGNSFQGGMTLDNKYIIEEYFHQVPKMLPPDGIYTATTMLPLFFKNDYWWPKGISGLYRPVAVLSYWLNYKINHEMGNDPLDPFQYHVVNLFLHWLAACLGFVLIRQLSRRNWVAFFAALLFVTHPIATESVSNIIGRSDILAAIATFACLTLYIRSVGSLPVEGDIIQNADDAWCIGPWLALFITIEVIVGLFVAFASSFSAPVWTIYAGVFALFAVPAVGFALTMQARRNQWNQAPWLMAMMGVLAMGLFAKESAIAVVGLIVVYDAIYRWTIEDLRRAVPSLLLFSILSAAGASVGLWIGQFGALGLSEGLTPILVILLVGSLITSAGMVLAWVFWVMQKPLSVEQLISPWTRFFLPYMVVIPPILLWLLARDWVFANSSPPETPFLDNPIRGLSFLAARMTASDVFVRLLSLLVLPVKLSSDYSFNQIPLFNGSATAPETWLAVAGCLTVLALIALIVFTFTRNKLICFLLVFYLIAYLPTSNFLIIIGSIMAERFLYLPLLAFVACLVLGLDYLCNWLARRLNAPPDGTPARPMFRYALVYVPLIILSFVYGIRARFRNDDWLSDVTLWTAAAHDSPNSFRSYQSLAFALYERYMNREAAGVYKNDPDQRQADIDACYQTAVKAKPIVDQLPLEENSARLYLHLGMYYSLKGVAVGHFSPNGVIVPGDAGEIWFRRAESVLQQGVAVDRAFDGINRRKEIARKIKKEADIADVGLPPVYATLGTTYGRLGEWSKCLQAYQYDRHLEPIDPESYLQIANAYANMGRAEAEAIALLQALLLDNSRTQLWQPIANVLAQLNQGGPPAVTVDQGKPHLHPEIPEVRSVVCSAYQGLVRIFILARRDALAQQLKNAAINQWKFSGELFDDLVTDPTTEAPVPPQPD